jgi:hypothetical protein
MSAITETEPGGEMVCIVSFSARPLDASPEESRGRRTFHVGERVRYLTHFFRDTPHDNPVGYMAVFVPIDPGDTTHYAATQDYFVSMDCWDGLRKYFASQLVVVDRDRTGPLPEGAYRLVECQ